MAEPASGGPVLRRGVLDDVPGLRALGEAVVGATYAPLDADYAALMLREWWSVEALGAMVARIPHLVAEQDGRVVGVVSVGRHEDREMVFKLYVHPEAQGRGLGSRLLDAAEELVEGDELWLESMVGNDRAAAFYRARGFEEVGRVPHPPWPDDFLLRKDLS